MRAAEYITLPFTMVYQLIKGWYQTTKDILTTSREMNLAETKQPLEDYRVDELKVVELALLDEESDTNETPKEGTVDIAFINADTGELEIVRIPEDQFSEQALKDAVQNSGIEQEGLVVLEVEVELETEESIEDDPNMRITHYPPSDRIH